MLRIGITGGIASGKSTVTGMLHDLGAVVLDADQAARAVVEPGQPAWEKIKEVFGPDYLKDDGTVDRSKLGSLVFGDEGARAQLENIVHPAVYNLLEDQAQKAQAMGQQIVFFDIPLLFETGYDSMLDRTVTVFVDEKTQLERLMRRDNLPLADAMARIDSQMSLAKKAELADYVINNAGSLSETKGQVNQLWQTLQQLVGEAGR